MTAEDTKGHPLTRWGLRRRDPLFISPLRCGLRDPDEGESMADGNLEVSVPAVSAPPPRCRWLLDVCGVVAVLGVHLLASTAPAQPPAADHFGDPLPRGDVAR